jgi:hypothetical protein
MARTGREKFARGAAGRGRRGRSVACLLSAVVVASTAAACGGEDGDAGAPTLTWYTNPDSGGQAEIARRCTEAADGGHEIRTAQLPREGPQTPCYDEVSFGIQRSYHPPSEVVPGTTGEQATALVGAVLAGDQLL